MKATASQLGRLRQCAWWARHDVHAPPMPSSTSAEHGTKVHKQIELGLYQAATPPTEPQAVAAVEEVLGRWSSKVDTILTECAYAWDPTTQQAVSLATAKGHRDYSAAPKGWLVGTADLVVLDDDKHGFVVDFKTGRPGYQDPASENLQLAMLANAVSSVFGLESVTVELWYLADPDNIDIDSAELDSFALDSAAAEIRSLLAKVQGSEPVSGGHCKYCPARAVCPAMDATLATIADLKPVVPRRRLPLHVDQIESADHAAWAYQQLRAIQGATDTAWAAMRAYADQHGGISLPGGKAYVRKEHSREVIECTERAREVLQAELGSGWLDACDYSTSKAAIQRAARGRPEPIAAVLRRVMHGLHAVGAVETKTTERYEEVDHVG